MGPIDCPLLSSLATGRQEDLFSEDVERCRYQIADCIKGARVLVIGGAGSIGSSAILQIARFIPRSLHVIDKNENNLIELIRDLRNQQDISNFIDFRTMPIDFGSPVMQRLIEEQPSYDLVMNFAALKHVRSEKDIYSILQMFDTNIVKPARLLRWLTRKLGAKSGALRYFCVSTDKAVNPVNMMGASKRLMEHVIFSNEITEDIEALSTSARFANVAFSDGSLLYSWIRRLEKRQPLVVPLDTKRFFVSLCEAGQISLIAAAYAQDRTIVIPRLQPEMHLRDLLTIAIDFLRLQGFEPQEYYSEDEAKANLSSDLKLGRYPLLLTQLDTSGEKPYEEFIGKDEQAKEIGLPNLLAISYRNCKPVSIRPFLFFLNQYFNNPHMEVKKGEIIKWVMTVVPEFHHIETGKNLDNRM